MLGIKEFKKINCDYLNKKSKAYLLCLALIGNKIIIFNVMYVNLSKLCYYKSIFLECFCRHFGRLA